MAPMLRRPGVSPPVAHHSRLLVARCTARRTSASATTAADRHRCLTGRFTAVIRFGCMVVDATGSSGLPLPLAVAGFPRSGRPQAFAPRARRRRSLPRRT
eukprot:12855602-Alexandrium_andersonii.AAC.1